MLSKIWKKAGNNLTGVLGKVKRETKYNSDKVGEKNTTSRDNQGEERLWTYKWDSWSLPLYTIC